MAVNNASYSDLVRALEAEQGSVSGDPRSVIATDEATSAGPQQSADERQSRDRNSTLSRDERRNVTHPRTGGSGAGRSNRGSRR